MMSGIFLILIVVVISIIVGVSQGVRKVKGENTLENEEEINMEDYFSELITYMLDPDPRTKIFEKRKSFIRLGISNIGGDTFFSLSLKGNNLTVIWELNNPFLGKHKLDWVFNKDKNQQEIFELIGEDLRKYQLSIL